MIYCYSRVSTDRQAQKNGTASQRQVIKEWLEANKIDPATVIDREDAGLSGKNTNRPEWQRMLSEVKKGDTILVYSLMRASRSLIDMATWIRAMREKGVRIVSIKEQLDLDTITGRLMANMIGSIAEWEREVIGQRMSDGIQAKIANGSPWGGGRVVDASRRGCSRLTPEQWEAARRRLEAGEGASSVAADYPISANALGKRAKRAR